MSSPVFQKYLLETYPLVRDRQPHSGRRAQRLRIVDEFFRLDVSALADLTTATTTSPSTQDPSTQDEDPVDALLSAAPGVVLRTDYSNDAAWTEFYALLRESEAEILADDDPAPAQGASGAVPDGGSSSGSDSEEEETSGAGAEPANAGAATAPLAFFSLLDFASDAERAHVVGAPNIALLRLVADADVRAAPPVPQGTKRIKPGHRLVDLNGFQEVYRGRSLWVYDQQSNTDGSVRMVNLEGDVYGTATGDSWRVRASHITEMQVNMAFHGMKIDFGGLDRWDYSERKRNLDYVTASIV